jgi:RNA polymerase sigma-B factor
VSERDPKNATRKRSQRGPAPAASPGPDERLASDEELLRRHGERPDSASRDELAIRFLPFARGLARRYGQGAESSDDLEQVASLGLLKALERFDPGRGIPFTAFAAPTILGELKRHFRDRSWALHVPRGLQERITAVEEAISGLTGELGQPPSVSDVAAQLELEDAEVLEALEAGQGRLPLSLDQAAPGRLSEEVPMAERIGAEDPSFEAIEDRETLRGGLPHLSERERQVLQLRFVEGLSQSQIAERVGYSQMHVSRILRGALQHLREAVGPEAEG